MELSNVIKTRLDLTLQRRQDFEFTIIVTDNNNAPVDLSGYGFYLEVRTKGKGIQLTKQNTDFTVINSNTRKLILSETDIEALSAHVQYSYFIQVTKPDTLKEIWYFGNIISKPEDE